MHYQNLPNNTAEKRRKARAHPRPKYHNLLNIFCHEIKLLNMQFCKAHAAPLRQNSNATTEPRTQYLVSSDIPRTCVPYTSS